MDNKRILCGAQILHSAAATEYDDCRNQTTAFNRHSSEGRIPAQAPLLSWKPDLDPSFRCEPGS